VKETAYILRPKRVFERAVNPKCVRHTRKRPARHFHSSFPRRAPLRRRFYPLGVGGPSSLSRIKGRASDPFFLSLFTQCKKHPKLYFQQQTKKYKTIMVPPKPSGKGAKKAVKSTAQRQDTTKVAQGILLGWSFGKYCILNRIIFPKPLGLHLPSPETSPDTGISSKAMSIRKNVRTW
jgi:hypothetical protein